VPTVPSRTAKCGRLPRYLVAAWRPWHGAPGIPDLLCFLGILVSVLYSLAMTVLTPSLIASDPLLLDMLSGSSSAVMAAGSFSAVQANLPLAVVMIVALPAMLKFDWVFWWAGKLWGIQVAERLGNRSPRSAAMVATVERRGIRFVWSAVLLSPFLPLPSGLAYAVAGWAELPLTPFLILDAAGRAVSAALLGACGYVLGPWGVALADMTARYALATLGLLAVIVVTPRVWHGWRTRGRHDYQRDDNHGEVTNLSAGRGRQAHRACGQ
jgi:membrane-associated protein